jgi:hypothetical protein
MMDARPAADLAVIVCHAKEVEEVCQLSPQERGVLLDQYIEATGPGRGRAAQSSAHPRLLRPPL